MDKIISIIFISGYISVTIKSNFVPHVTDTEQSIIKKLLGDGNDRVYDWRIRPRGTQSGDGGCSYCGDHYIDLALHPSPVLVTVNMYLRTISKVDDVNMEYSLHFTFREEWIDERLRFNDSYLKYVNLSPGQKIWMPDTFFQNEKDGKKHDIDTPNVLLRVYEGTDAYTTDDIDYRWLDHATKAPVQIKAGLRQSLPSFKLSDANTSICTSKTNTGAYSCLRLTLVLKREFSYYMLQLYIPSFMLVAVSWVSFWLDKDSVPARVTLGVTTLLTMTTQASGINAKLPPVSYTKAIDVWIGVCLAFIFGALLEFALINYAARRDMIENQRTRSVRSRGQTTYTNNPLLAQEPQPLSGTDVELQGLMSRDVRLDQSSTTWHQPISRRHRRQSQSQALFAKLWTSQPYRNSAKRIDVLARIVFPVTFVLFNICYWVIYLRPYLMLEDKLSEIT